MLPSAVFVKEKFQKEIGLVLTVQAKVPTTQNVHREVEADTQDQTSKLTTCLFDSPVVGGATRRILLRIDTFLFYVNTLNTSAFQG